MSSKKKVREGESVEFSCFATGTPKPNITWYTFNQVEQNFKLMAHTGNHLKIDNVNRYSSRRYQCRASNNIPPSDTRNLTFSVECNSFFFFQRIKLFFNLVLNLKPNSCARNRNSIKVGHKSKFNDIKLYNKRISFNEYKLLEERWSFYSKRRQTSNKEFQNRRNYIRVPIEYKSKNI